MHILKLIPWLGGILFLILCMQSHPPRDLKVWGLHCTDFCSSKEEFELPQPEAPASSASAGEIWSVPPNSGREHGPLRCR